MLNYDKQASKLFADEIDRESLERDRRALANISKPAAQTQHGRYFSLVLGCLASVICFLVLIGSEITWAFIATYWAILTVKNFKEGNLP